MLAFIPAAFSGKFHVILISGFPFHKSDTSFVVPMIDGAANKLPQLSLEEDTRAVL